jgi:hypothetical protein
VTPLAATVTLTPLRATLAHRLLHHVLIRGLLALLDLQQRIGQHFRHGIAGVGGRCSRGGGRCNTARKIGRAFLELLAFVVLEEDAVDAPLAQQIPLHFLGVVARRAGRRLVHPVNAVLLARLARVFVEALQFLDLAFFIALAPQLVDALAFLQRAFLLLPHPLLIAEKRWVP